MLFNFQCCVCRIFKNLYISFCVENKFCRTATVLSLYIILYYKYKNNLNSSRTLYTLQTNSISRARLYQTALQARSQDFITGDMTEKPKRVWSGSKCGMFFFVEMLHSGAFSYTVQQSLSQ